MWTYITQMAFGEHDDEEEEETDRTVYGFAVGGIAVYAAPQQMQQPAMYPEPMAYPMPYPPHDFQDEYEMYADDDDDSLYTNPASDDDLW